MFDREMQGPPTASPSVPPLRMLDAMLSYPYSGRRFQQVPAWPYAVSVAMNVGLLKAADLKGDGANTLAEVDGNRVWVSGAARIVSPL